MQPQENVTLATGHVRDNINKIKKLRREQRSKTHVIGHIGNQLGTGKRAVLGGGENPWVVLVVGERG